MDTANTIKRLENGNIELKLFIPWTKINEALENKIKSAVENAELPGFRKGKAPRDLVEPKLDRSGLISQSLGDLLPEVYTKAVGEHKLKPILYPQIKIDVGEAGKDWEFTATTCEAPVISLPDYKSGLSQVKTKPEQSKLSAAVEWISANITLKLPDLLVEEEANHRLSNLVENLTQIGISMEKYLQTKKLSAEDLKSQTAKTARQELEIEFVLAQIQSEQKLENRDKTIEFIQTLIA